MHILLCEITSFVGTSAEIAEISPKSRHNPGRYVSRIAQLTVDDVGFYSLVNSHITMGKPWENR